MYKFCFVIFFLTTLVNTVPVDLEIHDDPAPFYRNQAGQKIHLVDVDVEKRALVRHDDAEFKRFARSSKVKNLEKQHAILFPADVEANLVLERHH